MHLKVADYFHLLNEGIHKMLKRALLKEVRQLIHSLSNWVSIMCKL